MTSTVPCLLLFRPGLGCGFPQLSPSLRYVSPELVQI
jgi:hypothetical protein